jgi:hypothetical protein
VIINMYNMLYRAMEGQAGLWAGWGTVASLARSILTFSKAEVALGFDEEPLETPLLPKIKIGGVP